MGEHILVPSDGSGPATAALRFALEAFPDATVEGIRVVEPFADHTDAGSEPDRCQWRDRANDIAETQFDEAEVIAVEQDAPASHNENRRSRRDSAAGRGMWYVPRPGRTTASTPVFKPPGGVRRRMDPRAFLRVEGLTALSLALVGYFALDGPLWLLAALALAPDLSMLGYLAGPRLGGWCYNVVHTYTVPVALGALGVWADVPLALLVSLVWAGHIGADRLFGFGLKFDSEFAATHLSAQPAPVAPLTESDR